MSALLIASLLSGTLKTVHIFVSIFLIIVILLQPGKGDSGMGGAFGGGASTVFGARGSATFLSKVTSGCAIVFMLTSLTLSFLASRSESVVLGKSKAAATAPATTPAPAAPQKPATPEKK